MNWLLVLGFIGLVVLIAKLLKGKSSLDIFAGTFILFSLFGLVLLIRGVKNG